MQGGGSAGARDATLQFVRLGEALIRTTRVILHGRIVRQLVDRDETSAFRKEIIVTGSRVPLAMVRKRAADGEGTRAPVLLVHGFGQNRYTWHLPARSFSNYLARAGFDVFNLDLRGHGRSRHFGARRCRGVEDYVREDIPAAVEEVQALSGGRRGLGRRALARRPGRLRVRAEPRGRDRRASPRSAARTTSRAAR